MVSEVTAATDTTRSSRMAGNATTTTTTESRLEPVLHSILKSCILLGLGIIAGYGLFHAIFHHRCADVLDELERGYNHSLASLSELHQKSVEDHRQCLENDDKAQEISELRGRLEAQSDLVNSHRSLVQKHQITTSRLEEIQAELERKEAELFIIQKRIDLRHEEKDELERELTELKKAVEVELGEKNKIIESLQSSVEAFQMTEREILEHVQSRHGVMSLQL
jgi:predicted RNase H-like nuclease (RuvC/YqgF family)